MKNTLRLALFLVCSLPLLFGQADANKGQIFGTVTDPNSSVIAGAKLKITNVATGTTRELVSSSSGTYRAVLLDPGTYEVSATSAGFAENKINGLVVSVGSTTTVDVRMSVQSTSTTVEVGETLLQDAVPVASALVNSIAITNLPINGRRFQDFVLLTPTVVVESASRNQISFAGQRGINSNIMLDGADFLPPIRPLTCASFSASTYAGRLSINLHFDPRGLSEETSGRLLDTLLAHLREGLR